MTGSVAGHSVDANPVIAVSSSNSPKERNCGVSESVRVTLSRTVAGYFEELFVQAPDFGFGDVPPLTRLLMRGSLYVWASIELPRPQDSDFAGMRAHLFPHARRSA